MQLSFSSITLDYYPFHRAGVNPVVSVMLLQPLRASWTFTTKSLHSVHTFQCCSSSPGDSCVHWMHYSEATKTREGWARNLLDEFNSNVEMLKSAVRDHQGPDPAHGSPQHGERTRTSGPLHCC